MGNWGRRVAVINRFRPVYWLRNIAILSIIILFGNDANGQYFQTGQDPSSIRWRQINTTNFQLIYPDEFECQAQRVAFILNKVYDYGSKTLDFKPHRISVVLHTRTVKSNGLVAWAPKRIELFTTPHQQIYAQDWLEELGLHEFRHEVQMDKIQSELPGLLKVILGEQAAAIVVGAYLPFWFLEGDAVVTETALSNTGRGRMASFSMEYRARLIENGKYSFDKAYLGSYKDFVSDHYKLGYWMVGKTREKFGPEIWQDALQKIGKQPFSFTPLNSTVRKFSGFSTKQLYSDIFDELAQNWKLELDKQEIDPVTIKSHVRKSYTDYLYPEFYKDTLIVAYRTSIDDIGRFVMIYPDKSEKIIYTPGTIFEESVSLRENLLIWAERRADIRWSHADRSVIRILNIENKLVKEFQHTNKLFSPAISPDLKSFAAVEVDQANDIFLSVFDLVSGERKLQFKTSDNQYFFTPAWSANGDNIYFICLGSQGKYLASLDVHTKKLKQLTDYTYANLKNPAITNHQIIFSSDFSGKDNLYSYDLNSTKITQVLSARFGADYPTISNSGNQILFSNYTSSGYQLAEFELHSKLRNPEIESLTLKVDQLAKNLNAQESGIVDFVKTDSVKYKSKKYSKTGHLFNFHSWAPAYIDVNNYDIKPGFSLFSQNKLGTAETRIGYEYQIADKTGQYQLEFNYSGFFPELNAELTYGNAAASYYQITNTVNSQNEVIHSDTTIQRYSWNELSANLDIRLPLNLSKGKYSRVFIPEIKYTLNQTTPNVIVPENFNFGTYHAQTFRLYFYNLLHQSSQNLMPKWGQQIDLIFRNTPYAGNDLGKIIGGQSVFYFPGIFKNDGLKFYQGYQVKTFSSNHSFANFIRTPRGYSGFQNNKMYSLAVDYKFPLFYPDFSFGKLAYIKRLKSDVFFDYGWLSVPAVDQHGIVYPNHSQFVQKSLGIEFTSDLHVLRFFAPLEIGFRTIYRPDFSDFQFNLLLSIDFNGF
ncbi:MAG: hypothetical protein WAO52_11225 [Prolixibacteraceae bacterium]